MIPVLKWLWAFHVWCFNHIKEWVAESWVPAGIAAGVLAYLILVFH
jgi:hypothetical protein